MLLASRADTPALCRRRSRSLSAVEYCFQAYRCVLPAPLWHAWLARSSGLGKLLSAACAGEAGARGWHSLRCCTRLNRLPAWGCERCDTTRCKGRCKGRFNVPCFAFVLWVHAGTYLLIKCPSVYEHFTAAGAVVAAAAWRGSGPGVAPSAEELAEAGGACPICQVRPRP